MRLPSIPRRTGCRIIRARSNLRSCVGVVFTGEHDVYAASQPTEIKTQMYGNLYLVAPDKGPHLIEQTVAVYPSAGQAQDFLTSSQAQWSTCAKGEVDATLGFENGAGIRRWARCSGKET